MSPVQSHKPWWQPPVDLPCKWYVCPWVRFAMNICMHTYIHIHLDVKQCWIKQGFWSSIPDGSLKTTTHSHINLSAQLKIGDNLPSISALLMRERTNVLSHLSERAPSSPPYLYNHLEMSATSQSKQLTSEWTSLPLPQLLWPAPQNPFRPYGSP